MRILISEFMDERAVATLRAFSESVLQRVSVRTTSPCA